MENTTFLGEPEIGTEQYGHDDFKVNKQVVLAKVWRNIKKGDYITFNRENLEPTNGVVLEISRHNVTYVTLDQTDNGFKTKYLYFGDGKTSGTKLEKEGVEYIKLNEHITNDGPFLNIDEVTIERMKRHKLPLSRLPNEITSNPDPRYLANSSAILIKDGYLRLSPPDRIERMSRINSSVYELLDECKSNQNIKLNFKKVFEDENDSIESEFTRKFKEKYVTDNDIMTYVIHPDNLKLFEQFEWYDKFGYFVSKNDLFNIKSPLDVLYGGQLYETGKIIAVIYTNTEIPLDNILIGAIFDDCNYLEPISIYTLEDRDFLFEKLVKQ